MTGDLEAGVVLRAINLVNTVLHYVAGALIIGVMVFTVYNILGRWLFGAPLRGTVEFTQLAMIGIVYLGLAYAQQRDNHITVDLLYRRFGPRGRLALDAITTVLSLVVLALVAWQLYVYAGVLETGGRTTASRDVPLYPFAYVAIVGLVAFMLALTGTIVRRVRSTRHGDASEVPDLTWRAPL